MSTSIGFKAATFLAITFLLTWGGWAAAWSGGMRELQGDSGHPAAGVALVGPLVAALVCTLAFERGQRRKALGLRFRPNRWWLFAMLLAFAFGLIALIANVLVSGGNLLDIDDWKEPFASLTDSAMGRQVVSVLGGFVVGMLYNLLCEELGWRGYLYHLWRGLGFWRYTIATGIIWGIWHWPMIVLFGMGGNWPAAATVVFYPVMCSLLAFCQTVIRDRSGSVIAAGIFHGSWNAVSGMRDGIFAVFAVIAIAMVIYAWRFQNNEDEQLPGMGMRTKRCPTPPSHGINACRP